MTITSIGYAGVPGQPAKVDASAFAALARGLGSSYYVDDVDDWLVTGVVGQDRTVQVALGGGGGHGIRDVVTGTPPTVQLDPIASGSRWDLIVARRDWTASTTTFAKVTGTSAKVIPSGRLSGAGTQDDQPIALVQVTAGQSMPTDMVDLRVWPHKVATASSLLAFPTPRYGQEVVVGRTRYRRDIVNGTPVWAPQVGDFVELAASAPQNFTAGIYTNVAWPASKWNDDPAGWWSATNGQVQILMDGVYSLALNVGANVRSGAPDMAARIYTPNGPVHCEQSSARLRVSASATRFLKAGTVLAAGIYVFQDSITVPADGSIPAYWTVTRVPS